MKTEDVPQDDNTTLKGYSTKVMYAVDDAGQYTKIRSNGWEVEELVLHDVVNDFKEKAEQAKARIMNDETSPLSYFMYANLMEIDGLAYGVGLSKWRVRRHMRPEIFAGLNDKTLRRYAEFFKIDVNILAHFKETLSRDSD